MNRSTLLICTVGGSTEPIVATVKRWEPARVYFVHTPQTKSIVDRAVAEAHHEGADLDAGRVEHLELPDGEDLASCLDQLRQLTPIVSRWLERTPSAEVIVDFTGGTKCMSAAIGIQASRWNATFSYVGGGTRTKEGVGIVVSGTERVIARTNPWNSLGHQAVDEFVVLFDQLAFRAAASVANRAKMRVSRPDRKRELAALEQLALGFDAWDRFDHAAARKQLENVVTSANDLRVVFGSQRADRVVARVERIVSHMQDLTAATPPSRHHVVDLLANARRRADEGRFDDAVARIYRAIEAVAQVSLKERHGISSTKDVPPERIPPSLRDEWIHRGREGGISIGLQDAYRLLAELGDRVGDEFRASGLHDPKKSPLIARNVSILAHGFERVTEATFTRLWSAALRLAEIGEGDLPTFPALSESTQ